MNYFHSYKRAQEGYSMILPKIFCVLSRREFHRKKTNHCNESAYKEPITDLEPNPEMALNHTIDDCGDSVYYCGSINELFPQHAIPTDQSLLKIRSLLKLKTDVPPAYIWLCINIHADRLSQNEEVMSILRNDPNAITLNIE